MSKVIDYSKFDDIDSDDCNSETEEQASAPLSNSNDKAVVKQGSHPNRYVFEYNGQQIYEWEQSLEEVTMYVNAPKGKKANDFRIIIETNRLRIGLKGFDRFFIDEPTFGKVDTSESSWYIDDSIIHIILIKVARGSVWETPLLGKADNTSGGKSAKGIVDPVTKEKMTQELMLERFAEENPGFDFRDAKFNGAAPDPREFMGGIKYT